MIRNLCLKGEQCQTTTAYATGNRDGHATCGVLAEPDRWVKSTVKIDWIRIASGGCRSILSLPEHQKGQFLA
jgi:hypothetical protein